MDEQEQDFIPSAAAVEAAINDPTNENEEMLSILTPEERAIGAKILPALVAKIGAKVEADGARRLADTTKELIASNDRMMKDKVAELQASLKPPDPKELETLLSQDYGEMAVKVFPRKGHQGSSERVFTLRELPQSAEKKMVKMLTQKVVPHLSELATMDWAVTTSNADKLKKVVEIIPDALDVLAACCAICFDPYEEQQITTEWIQDNMSSSRIVNVIEAQLTVSKIRDFGSAVYRLIPR